MDINELNERLRTADSDEQLRLLFFKTKKKMRGVLHGEIVDTISIKDRYARYRYVDSNIIGYCKIQILHQYISF